MNTVACGLIHREKGSTDDDEAKPLYQKSSSQIICKHSKTCPSDDESKPLCREVSNSQDSSGTNGYAYQYNSSYINYSQETECNQDSDDNLSHNDLTRHTIDDSNEILSNIEWLWYIFAK